MSRPTAFGVPSIIGTAESLSTTVYCLCLAKSLCHVTSQALLGVLSYYFKWPVFINKIATNYIYVLWIILMCLVYGMSKINNYIT